MKEFPRFDRLTFDSPEKLFQGLVYEDVIEFARFLLQDVKEVKGFIAPSTGSNSVPGWLVQEPGEGEGGRRNLYDSCSWGVNVSNGTIQSILLIPRALNAVLFPYNIQICEAYYDKEIVFQESHIFKPQKVGGRIYSTPYSTSRGIVGRAMANTSLPLSHALLYELFVGTNTVVEGKLSLSVLQGSGLLDNMGLPFEVLKESFISLNGGIDLDSVPGRILNLAERVSGAGLGLID